MTTAQPALATSPLRRRVFPWMGSLLLLLLLSSPPPAAAQTRDPLIPRSVFFGNPERANVQISPDGTRLSYLAPHRGVLNIWIENLDGTGQRPITSTTDRPIRRYFWAYNNRQIIYAQDEGGNENYHLFSIDLDTGGRIDLTPFENVQARMIAREPHFPDEILIGVNDRQPDRHDVIRVNTTTGSFDRVFENTRNFASVIADSQYQIRVGMKFRRDGGLNGYLRDSGLGDWYELASWSAEDAANSRPLGFSRDGQSLYVIDSRDVNTGRLFKFQFTTDPDVDPYRMIAADERADAGSIVFDPRTGHPQAVAFEYARRVWRLLDQSIRADWTYLNTVADGELTLESRDQSDSVWIVSYVRDNGPLEYYQYDRRERKARFLFNNRSELAGLQLARMQSKIINARDGLPMVSYLTEPPSATGRVPMVLLVHGGPWARDRWGYNAVHQWLANRGYAVLSVNFRGSAGFGKQFLNAGNLEWAGRMHDDLIDAVNWAVEAGVADPDRVAIMGGSYGGYATLVGLTFTPDFFAAGVDIVGPSHVRTLLESIPPYWEPIRAMFEARVGSLDNPEYLDRISPLTRVDAINKPLLIGQGRNDPRVKESESLQIVEAMQNKNLPVTYVVFPDEGHGFSRAENNLAFFAITESFLAQHLGGRAQPISGELASSSAEIPAGMQLIDGLSEAMGLLQGR